MVQRSPFVDVDISPSDSLILNGLVRAAVTEFGSTVRLDAEDWFMFAGLLLSLSKEVIQVLEKCDK